MSDRPAQLLLVDDDPTMEPLLRNLLPRDRFEITWHRTLASGLAALPQEWDVVLVSSLLGDGVGLKLLEESATRPIRPPVILIAASRIVSTTIEGMKCGAFDCIRKPIDLAQLRERIEAACRSRQRCTPASPAEPLGAADPYQDDLPVALVGENERMLGVFKDVGRLAQCHGPVLIQGECGTGRESVARCIHRHSSRSEQPFAVIYCPGYVGSEIEQQVENQLQALHKGGGGTIFLQEIADISVTAQSQLLAWIRRGIFAGDAAGLESGVRLMATSSTPLDVRVRTGPFRADLYYLLGAHLIEVPALRQRISDIPLLVAHILRQLKPNRMPAVSDEAMRLLTSHMWPGNIDELTSVLRRCVVAGNGCVVADESLRDSIRSSVSRKTEESTGLHMTDWGSLVSFHLEGNREDLYLAATEELDIKLLPMVLTHTGGNQSEAARLLGMTRASLRKKIRGLGLDARRKSGTGSAGSASVG
jgi:DNA-binding NtrC family response regulator